MLNLPAVVSAAGSVIVGSATCSAATTGTVSAVSAAVVGCSSLTSSFFSFLLKNLPRGPFLMESITLSLCSLGATLSLLAVADTTGSSSTMAPDVAVAAASAASVEAAAGVS